MAETLGFTVPLRQRFRPLSITCPGFLTTCLGHEQDTFTEKETAQASELLRRYSGAEVRSLIDYAVERFKETHFSPSFFGAVTAQPASRTVLPDRTARMAW